MSAPRQSFAALRVPGSRAHFATSMLSMMADNVEHVISYWMIYQKFHSEALGGFAVVSHWLPYLLFSVLSGALADRFDPRRMIQLGMALFMLVSIGWGWFFLTDTLQMWQAMVLLVLHGCAGVLWLSSSQILLHDIVKAEQLQSAVRLNATARYLGILVGPAGGAAFFVGTAYQAQMPGFAPDLGHGDPGISYRMLLAADAAGALAAGIALETFGLLRPNPRTALVLALLWGVALGSFALMPVYPIALLLLLAAGFLELSFNSMSQTLVQLHAPAEKRGRIIGVFSMASLGSRMFSGFSVGILGQMIGIHWSLAVSAGLILVLIMVLLSRRASFAH